MNLLSLLGACLLSAGVGGAVLQGKISSTESAAGYKIYEYSQEEDCFRKYCENMTQGQSSFYTMLVSYYGDSTTWSYTYNYGANNNVLDLEYYVSYPIINNLIQENFFFCVVDVWDTIRCDGYSWTLDTWSRYYFYLDYAFNTYSFFIDWGIYRNYLFDSPNAVAYWYFGTKDETFNIQNPNTLMHYSYNPIYELDFQDHTRMAMVQTGNQVEYQFIGVGFHTDDNELSFYEYTEGMVSFVYQRIVYAKLSDLQVLAYQNGYNDGLTVGKELGYQEGLQASGYSFFDLFGAVADTPVIMVRNLFNFDLFGVNALSVIMTLFTALALFYIFRKIV